MEFFTLAITGAFVGLIVGLTGVGGGALMTPLLLTFGFNPSIAIGTDLLFAAFTKTSGMISHARHQHIDWKIVGRLASGSIPGAIITGWFLSIFLIDSLAYEKVLTLMLGIMLILTSMAILFRHKIQRITPALSERQVKWITPLSGLVLGIFVTLSSVGAGAFGTAVIMLLYPYLKGTKVVGSDIAHAVPLTFVASFVHIGLGNIDWMLLLALLCGSIPAIHIGAALSRKLSGAIMQKVLAGMLMLIGLKYALF